MSLVSLDSYGEIYMLLGIHPEKCRGLFGFTRRNFAGPCGFTRRMPRGEIYKALQVQPESLSEPNESLDSLGELYKPL